MATQTATFSFNIPDVGGDNDNWGSLLNANWNGLETILAGTFDGSGARTSTPFNIDALTGANMTFTGTVSLGIAGKITENVHAESTSGAVNIDPANGTIQTIAMTGNITLTSSLASGEFVTLLISSVDSNNITWPAMNWMFGNEPVLDTTADNFVQLWNINGTLYGSYIGPAS